MESDRLAALNSESRACLSRWRIAVACSPELGRYLLSASGIPAGETALVLPPNRILRFHECTDFNTVIQVRRSEQPSERLYSASLTDEDEDNFLSHSCVRGLTLTLRATRAHHARPGVNRCARCAWTRTSLCDLSRCAVCPLGRL